MSIATGSLIRPLAGVDYRGPSALRSWGLSLGAVGMGLVTIAFISSLTLAGAVSLGAPAPQMAAQDAWTFGLATAALGTLKLGIALVRWGIVRRLWVRVESVKTALPTLTPAGRKPVIAEGTIRTPYGVATTQSTNTWAIWIEGVRRFGVAIYLASIALGLATIVNVLRFQSIRVRQLPTETESTATVA